MATPSPSEFLTFYRRVVASPTIRRGMVSGLSPMTQAPHRPFSLSATTYATGSAKNNNKHATDKGSEEVQSESTSKGREAKAKDAGGTATTQKDDMKSTQRTKQEHPNAPDVIGMQDERGSRGRG